MRCSLERRYTNHAFHLERDSLTYDTLRMLQNVNPRLLRAVIAIILLLGLLLNAGTSLGALDRVPTKTSKLQEPWQLIVTSVSPPARYTHGMTYDIARDRMVMFGGDDKGTNRLDDTWEFDGGDWMQVSPANSPIGRVNISQAMVYDAQRGKTILFGGLASFGRLDDTWEYDGVNWIEIPIPNPPPGRDGHALAYDDTRQLTVLFGGYNHTDFFMNDTWEYDGSNWTQVQPAQSPPGRNHHSLAYDHQRGVVVLFGGHEESGALLNDTWEYDGSTWQQVFTPDSPPARRDHSLAYDAGRGVVVLFGGTSDGTNPLDDTWEYDGNTWYPVSTNLKPQARLGFPMVYDGARERVVLFSGGYFKAKVNAYEDTWAYTGGEGVLSPIVGEARADIGMPYDIYRGCPSPYIGCDGPYHGFHAGVSTDLVTDAYRSGEAYDIQARLLSDHLANPGRYRYRTARYAEDMLRYFTAQGQWVDHDQAYSPGDISFFDRDGDGLADHVSIISVIDASGRPLSMVDAPGYSTDNPFGLAVERAWSTNDEISNLGHARVEASSGPAEMEDDPLRQLRVHLDNPDIRLRLVDANGKSVSDSYNENLVASNNEDFIPYIPGGTYMDLGSQLIISVTHPLMNTDQYFIELHASTETAYTALIETMEGEVVTDSASFNQVIGAGTTQRVEVTLHELAGTLLIKSTSLSISPAVDTPGSVLLNGLIGATAEDQFTISETSGQISIDMAVIDAGNLVNQAGETISYKDISIQPDGFTITPGESLQVTVQVELDNNISGLYQGNLLLSAENANPVSIPLTVIIQTQKLFIPLVE
jgi:hypothetical protein